MFELVQMQYVQVDALQPINSSILHLFRINYTNTWSL